MYQCITLAHLDPKKIDEVLEAARKLAKETRMQRGNLAYNVVKPDERDDLLVIVEMWETAEDFQEHISPEGEGAAAMAAFVAVVEPASTKPSEFYPGFAVI
ncbi:MAG: hypothetical protein GX127_07705 [Eubacteriaceae bacterium]|nr:hypothetical protein [Eubacteriaceae bacterium]